jgi:hypothetical protein
MPNSGTPVPATQPFTVTLQAQEWNQVLAALGEAPYRVSAPLIQAIGGQLQEQAGTAGGVAPNGYDTVVPPSPPN